VPADSVLPTLPAGTPREGESIAETNGQWTPTAIGFAYQWEDCDATGANCLPISGATSHSYAPTQADVGDTLRVVEMASDANGAGVPVVTAASGVVVPLAPPVDNTLPGVSGTAKQGSLLSVTTGDWTGSPTAYAYQWEDCTGTTCTPIAGATGAGYTLASSDVGSTVTAEVSASNDGGTGGPVLATASGAVLPAAPANTIRPSINGKPLVGQILSVVLGVWANGPTAYGHQWARCTAQGTGCSPIAGATGSQYTPSAADEGHTIVVAEAASNLGGIGSAVISAPTAVITSPDVRPHDTARPVISGRPAVGRPLSAGTGTWTGTTPLSFSYQWLFCSPECSTIAGATKSKFTPTSTQLGARIEVLVGAANPAGVVTATSAQSAPVTALLARAALRAALAPTGKAARLATVVNKGASLKLKTPLAGTLTIRWSTRAKHPTLLGSVHVVIRKAETATVTLKLTKAGKKLLRGAGKRIRLNASGSYAASGLPTVTASRTATLSR
jgi:hypothetical protein